MDGHLGRIGAGDQVGCSEQVEEGLVIHPSAAPDDLVTHDGDMGRRPAEGREPEPEKEGDDLSQASWGGSLRLCCHGRRRPPIGEASPGSRISCVSLATSALEARSRRRPAAVAP